VATGDDQALTDRCVLLTGASSQIGLFAISRLLAAGFHVAALSRHGKPDEFPVLPHVDWLQGLDELASAGSLQYLLSAGPLSVAQSLLHNMPSLQTAAVFSSSSVQSKRDSADPSERSEMEQMLASETAIRATAGRGGVKLVIFRPTLIYGCGLDANITRLADWILRYGFIPVNGRAEGLRQPVHADDLAAAAVAALTTDGDLPVILSLAGGSTLSYAEMVRKIFRALGKKERLLHLPQWLMVTLLSLARLAGLVAGTNAEMLRRQRHDLVFDDHEARELLGYRPRPFEPKQADFSIPVFGHGQIEKNCLQDGDG